MQQTTAFLPQVKTLSGTMAPIPDAAPRKSAWDDNPTAADLPGGPCSERRATAGERGGMWIGSPCFSGQNNQADRRGGVAQPSALVGPPQGRWTHLPGPPTGPCDRRTTVCRSRTTGSSRSTSAPSTPPASARSASWSVRPLRCDVSIGVGPRFRLDGVHWLGLGAKVKLFFCQFFSEARGSGCFELPTYVLTKGSLWDASTIEAIVLQTSLLGASSGAAAVVQEPELEGVAEAVRPRGPPVPPRRRTTVDVAHAC